MTAEDEMLEGDNQDEVEGLKIVEDKVNVSKPLLALFSIKDRKYRIEYEGLHLLCLSCGRYGNYKEVCLYSIKGKYLVQVEDGGKEKVIEEGSSKQVEESRDAVEDSLWKVVQK
ncbi:hypothetical protein KIW84_024234 [Lathyrus oleraceus]|uniref:Uncharacterized protein n=1 Tax=Pisum sativum TaxID=3888 RepID=A0A9D4YHH8_PEA|nr:hypothetical protein KIW84_024234 [Pisum sativum]